MAVRPDVPAAGKAGAPRPARGPSRSAAPTRRRASPSPRDRPRRGPTARPSRRRVPRPRARHRRGPAGGALRSRAGCSLLGRARGRDDRRRRAARGRLAGGPGLPGPRRRRRPGPRAELAAPDRRAPLAGDDRAAAPRLGGAARLRRPARASPRPSSPRCCPTTPAGPRSCINGVVADLNDAGLVSGQLSDLSGRSTTARWSGWPPGCWASSPSAASTLVLLLSALVFMAIESSGFRRRMALVGAERPHLPVAMTLFAQGTRSYLLVSTVFGAVVAVGDWIALAIIGVPAAALWGLLAFVTNYVPNIGFVLGRGAAGAAGPAGRRLGRARRRSSSSTRCSTSSSRR